MDARYHALIRLLAELIKEYHEKQANKHPASIGELSGANRGENDRPAQLAE